MSFSAERMSGEQLELSVSAVVEAEEVDDPLVPGAQRAVF
jgi:hypothetical protein